MKEYEKAEHDLLKFVFVNKQSHVGVGLQFVNILDEFAATKLETKENIILRLRIVDEIKAINYNHVAMSCGLEDKNISDKYEAMKYGWEQAIEAIFNILNV